MNDLGTLVQHSEALVGMMWSRLKASHCMVSRRSSMASSI